MSVDVIAEQSRAAPSTGRRWGRWWTGLCWLLVAPGFAWAVVRIGGLERGPLVQLVAFTPYVAAWALVPAVLALALRRWAAASVALLVAGALFAAVAPRSLPDDQPPAAGPTLRVLTANLLVGGADPAALVALVRTNRVDLLAMQEFTPAAQAALDAAGLAELLPHRQLNALPGVVGSALYSRFPLSANGVRKHSGYGFTQAYATVAVPGAPPVLVESIHPTAPSAVSLVRNWRANLYAEPAATPDGPLRILAGDFNATLDHAPLRALLDTGYVDAAASVGAGLTGTWGPYDGDDIPPVTIDHVLVDRRIAVREVSVHPLRHSDHRPVLAEVTLPGDS
jgi:endonuclease/exonuclease/phosphatase (EEP) superfamily protein YafD